MNVFERKNGLNPCLLIDGHRSRLEYSFLEYICNPLHEWVVAILMPYGTDLWQVGDTIEQNGCYNMASVVKKRMIVEEKLKYMIDTLTIESHEIIIIINYAWTRSFSRIESNRQAIADRGWYPYNRILMTDPSIRASITVE